MREKKQITHQVKYFHVGFIFWAYNKHFEIFVNFLTPLIDYDYAGRIQYQKDIFMHVVYKLC